MDILTNRAEDKSRIKAHWRFRLHEIIFEADTTAGKYFDIALLWLILASALAVMLESVADIEKAIGDYLRIAEWFFTIIFTLEFFARIISVGRPLRYLISFYGIIDVLSILPTYLSLLVSGSQFLLVVRVARLLRVFRIFKLTQFLGEADALRNALKRSQYKVTVFLGAVVSIATIAGTIMYMIEGPENGYTSIPKSIYWAVVTLTTVGYGDIAPKTPLGQTLATIIMVLGYGIIAVPTGIVTAELTQSRKTVENTQHCHECSVDGHANDAIYCRRCGSLLNPLGDVPPKPRTKTLRKTYKTRQR